MERKMRGPVLLAAFVVALAAGPARSDSVDDELRAYDDLLRPTATALSQLRCDARDCVPSLLNAMRGYDQAMRHGIITIRRECARLDEASRKRCADGVRKRFNASDRANTERLKRIVDKFGWPSTAEFGEAAEQAAWVVAQHADLDRPFQHQVLQLLEASTEKGDSPPRHFAYLYDRVAVAEHRLQRWGTQGRCVNGRWHPLPIADPDGVDERRAAAGMAPLAAYGASFDPKTCAEENLLRGFDAATHGRIAQ
jgi:hypothetical protein